MLTTEASKGYLPSWLDSGSGFPLIDSDKTLVELRPRDKLRCRLNRLEPGARHDRTLWTTSRSSLLQSSFHRCAFVMPDNQILVQLMNRPAVKPV
ncbi:hypothetical protein PI124_g17270 [Phytophthora idaei]|nr:hypothetical protein PI125_g1014 [Phytophthora idaei]KAG3139204.1 hypothetical protein PI126_g16554 [Phytophthora idaei]KAG3237750.1 hypothetical protein PI124_g17270 [Phytophthora idaei]